MTVVAADRDRAAGAAAGGLTGEQEEAVERRQGALLLAANAGSGKTTVLVERFVRAVHFDGVAPSGILAITFTERAAGEVRERVRRRLRELGDRGAARETETAFVSTIHGFCARLLRAHPLAAGLAPGFGVLEEGTAAGLRQEAFERALAAWMSDPRAIDLAAACGVDQLATAIGSVHDELRSRGRAQPRLPVARPRHEAAAQRGALAVAGRALAGELDGARVGPRVAAALAQLQRDPVGTPLEELKLHRGARALQSAGADAYEAARLRCVEAEADAAAVVGLELVGDLLEGFAGEYAGLKAARGALDFDDLELCARDLLAGDAELRRRWSERFELLMVDELQDTNPREMAIIGALDRGNLFTVGDEFQSIYGFRHADVGIFRARRRALAGVDAVRALSRNFRSRPAILAAVNATFAPFFGTDFVPLVPGRDDPPGPGQPLVELLVNDAKGWEEPTTPGAGPAWRRAEAAILARRIDELIAEEAVRPGEIVVLLRYATAAGIYERALADRGVAVATAPGGGFYTAPEVCDLADYVRVLANPLDDLALYGVLASPLGGVGADGLAALGLAAGAAGRPPWEVLDAWLAGGPAAPPPAPGPSPAAGEPAPAAGEPAPGAELARLGAADRARLVACHALIAAERSEAPRRGLAELLLRSGYRRRAGCGPLGTANLNKLQRLARDFEAREGRDLRRFADRLAEGRLGSAREQDAQLAETAAVRLMTVHAAKGLEFPVVCYADLGHGPPIGLPLILTDGDRVGVRLTTLAATRPDAFAYAELRGERDRAAMAEERRIAYVAMTRARDRLICSGAADFARWPTPGPSAPTIAWLAPAMVADLPARLTGPPGTCDVDLGGVPVRLTLTAAGETASLAGETVCLAGETARLDGETVHLPGEAGALAQGSAGSAGETAGAAGDTPAGPAETGRPAGETVAPPAETGGGPAATGGAATATGGTATETGGGPAATGGAAAATGGAAAETGGPAGEAAALPAETGGGPAATGGAAAESGGAAAETGRPAGETVAPPAETGGGPAATGGAATATGGTATETGGGPAATGGAAAESGGAAAETGGRAGASTAPPAEVAAPAAGRARVAASAQLALFDASWPVPTPPHGRSSPASAELAPSARPAASESPRPGALASSPRPGALESSPRPGASGSSPRPGALESSSRPDVSGSSSRPGALASSPRPGALGSSPRPDGSAPPPRPGVAALSDGSRPAPVSAPADRPGAGLRRPPEPDPAPLSVSYSSLADYARCGYGYYLRRVVGLAEVAPPPGLAAEAGTDAAVRGRIVHRLLEALDFARPRPPTAAAVADAVGGAPTADAAEIADLVAAFAASPLCRRLAAAGSIRREASFALSVGPLLVGGYIDVIATEADGAVLVVDYKTDRLAPDEDVAARVAADYELQRRIYGLAALQAGAPSVEVAYCFLRRPDDVVAVRYAPADAARLEADLAAVAAPLRDGRFAVAARPHRRLCASCPGRARLCSWGEEVTLGAAVHQG